MEPPQTAKNRLIHRREFVGGALRMAAGTGATLGAFGGVFAAEKRQSVQALPSFDREVTEFMKARNVPGGALAVVKDGRLVYAKGYGYADRENKTPATAETLFRIASISKPITGVAVMKLAEEGKLNLDDRAFDYIDLEPVVEFGKQPDRRLKAITIRQALQHTGGWDRNQSFDPMFRSDRIARMVGVERPANASAVIRYMLGKPLDFSPGAKYAYSNFGYCVLGRVIEKVTGQAYVDYVKRGVLKPMGIARMRIGRTLEGRQAEGETRYYMPGGKGKVADNVFGDTPGKVPWPYGGFHLEAMDAHGGWIASAVDLARFAAAMDKPGRAGVLNADSNRELYRPPEAPVSRVNGALKPYFYGLGWLVRPKSKAKANYWHGGSLPGTNTLLVRRWDGLSWAVLFNQRNQDKKLPDGAIDSALHRAANAVASWPAHDLFDAFG